MELLTILVKMASLVSNACRDAERLPVALISCGVVQAAAALCLLISRPPGGIFLHHGKAPFCLYYAILIAVFVFGLFEASAGFWVSSNVNGRRAAGRRSCGSPSCPSSSSLRWEASSSCTEILPANIL
ncbi:hypothetical protein ACQ4PT_071408 [Festuca glaucescens]